MMYVGMRAILAHRLPWRQMPRLALLVAALPLLAAPSAEAAAELTTNRVCYLQQQAAPTVSVNGAGFPASSPYTVALDGAPLPGGTGQTDDAGAMTGTFGPALAEGELERRFDLAVGSGQSTAATSFTVTRFNADFRPQKGNPARLRVRFSVHGFNLKQRASDAEKDVWLHYVRPNGKRRKSIRIGRTQGHCGSIERTNRRPLFPFRAERGTWRLQFDTSRRYVRGTTRSPFAFYSIGVRIRRAG
jgi:hypothetical protein